MCASETEIEKFKKDELKKKFNTLISEIEHYEGFNEGILSTAKTENWLSMNSFTHSGFLQVMRRNKEKSIEPNYTDEEIIELVYMANALGMLSALQIALLAGKNNLATDMLEK
jgi:hypothetical protein